MDWQRLLKPRYWSQNKPTCPIWDKVLDRALDEYGVQELDNHTCTVGPLVVWVSNWPYAYGHSYGGGYPNTGLPKVATRKKLRAAIQDAMIRKVEQWPNKSRLKVVN